MKKINWFEDEKIKMILEKGHGVVEYGDEKGRICVNDFDMKALQRHERTAFILNFYTDDEYTCAIAIDTCCLDEFFNAFGAVIEDNEILLRWYDVSPDNKPEFYEAESLAKELEALWQIQDATGALISDAAYEEFTDWYAKKYGEGNSEADSLTIFHKFLGFCSDEIASKIRFSCLLVSNECIPIYFFAANLMSNLGLMPSFKTWCKARYSKYLKDLNAYIKAAEQGA